MPDTYLIRWMTSRRVPARWDIWIKRGTRDAVYHGSYHGPIQEWIDALSRHDPTAEVTIISR